MVSATTEQKFIDLAPVPPPPQMARDFDNPHSGTNSSSIPPQSAPAVHIERDSRESEAEPP
eukprot:CAMPEP_0170506242 /NCGR_PEP_ID=MMETSP0208-20121228/54187_1 /TAXON_ID=197538 /ORGANISM="Strombidium inclinatum, Strain S3" /LENGTH=60 /DNA_ID=CAMNT_0010787651 /DNA_START=1148 /DNA_END=1330 /DNA_ORIENTATION=-